MFSRSFGVEVRVSFELWSLSVVSHLDDLKILSLQKSRDQFIDLLAWNHLWVHEEKLKVDRLMTVLVDEEVPVCLEELRDL